MNYQKIQRSDPSLLQKRLLIKEVELGEGGRNCWCWCWCFKPSTQEPERGELYEFCLQSESPGQSGLFHREIMSLKKKKTKSVKRDDNCLERFCSTEEYAV